MSLLFEWDEEKANSNLRKHRVSFDEAQTVFLDVSSLTVPDVDHSQIEARFRIVGMSNKKRVYEIPETDFSRGIRGRHASALKSNGYIIRVHRRDGSFTERRVAADSLVSLDADVKEHFPDSAAVNRALRKLISPAKLKEKRTSTPRRTV